MLTRAETTTATESSTLIAAVEQPIRDTFREAGAAGFLPLRESGGPVGCSDHPVNGVTSLWCSRPRVFAVSCRSRKPSPVTS